MKTLILGMGNQIRCDDGVGNRIAQVLQRELHDPSVTVIETNTDSLGLLDFLPGYDRAIIIDAIQTPDGRAGQIHRLSPQDLAAFGYLPRTHNAALGTVLELGTRLGLALPEQIIILAIEVTDVTTFSEELTPKVKEAIPKVLDLVFQEIEHPQSQQQWTRST